jgi:DNA mismatch repair protein MutL
MADIINLLPDNIANQIAAGEVIQRPASVVKELVENAVDAGAKNIEIIIKDAGRTSIRIVDDGKGMSQNDARMCFERHATSKIRSAEDLFNLFTKGFRGEALASIAAVAHVDLQTRLKDAELGNRIIIAGSRIEEETVCNCPVGSSFEVKNLFFNLPARRNFLKSDKAEFMHIQDEFLRVALVHPSIAFKLFHNNKPIYNLASGTLKQRITTVFGANYNSKILPIEQQTDIVTISGFIGKPEFARKTRGEQYLFVNDRFIKHPYFNHAIVSAFEEVIPQEHFPTYFIYFQIHPKLIDVNIHPTKTEVKFQEEKFIYPILRASVKKVIGMFHLNGQIDFENISPIDFGAIPQNTLPRVPKPCHDPDYNPFRPPSKNTNVSHASWKPANPSQGWEQIYESLQENIPPEAKEQKQLQVDFQTDENEIQESQPRQNSLFQTQNRYIVSKLKSGFIVIDQYAATERILYEKNMSRFENQVNDVQKLLFPETLTFSVQDTDLVEELLPDFLKLGFEIDPFGNHTFIISGVPTDFKNHNLQEEIEHMLESYKNNLLSLKISKKNNLAHSIARSAAESRKNKPLADEEMQSIVNELFSCSSPQVSPSGRKICILFNETELLNMFHS